jgi:GAF domain-containing protein
MVSGVNGALVRLRDREQLLEESCRIAVSVGGYLSAAVSLLEPDVGLRIAAVSGNAAATVGTVLPLVGDPAALTVSARAVRDGKPVVVRDIADPSVAEATRALAHASVHAVVALPLFVDRTVVGVLALGADSDGLLDERELQLLQELAANLSFALQYLERQNAVHFLSYFDPLTGFAKRTLFCERLGQRLARRAGAETRPAVIVLDIERRGGRPPCRRWAGAMRGRPPAGERRLRRVPRLSRWRLLRLRAAAARRAGARPLPAE